MAKGLFIIFVSWLSFSQNFWGRSVGFELGVFPILLALKFK